MDLLETLEALSPLQLSVKLAHEHLRRRRSEIAPLLFVHCIPLLHRLPLGQQGGATCVQTCFISLHTLYPLPQSVTGYKVHPPDPLPKGVQSTT